MHEMLAFGEFLVTYWLKKIIQTKPNSLSHILNGHLGEK